MDPNEIVPRWGPPSIDHKISDKNVNQILDYLYIVIWDFLRCEPPKIDDFEVWATHRLMFLRCGPP